MPPQPPVEEHGRVLVEPVFSDAYPGDPAIGFDLRVHELPLERDEHVRRAEVAVVLRHLVLEDQVVSKRVPRQLARKPVVLVEVVRLCVKTRSGSTSLSSSNASFTSPPVVRQKALGDPVRNLGLGGLRETPRHSLRLVGAPAGGSEHDPGHMQIRPRRISASSVPPQPISMSSA